MSDIDFSNIEDLYAQPLPVIKKCVQGKWKCLSQEGIMTTYFTSRFVEITEDHVVITEEEDVPYPWNEMALYHWEKRKVNGKYEHFMRCYGGISKPWEYIFYKIEKDRLYINPYIEGMEDWVKVK